MPVKPAPSGRQTPPGPWYRGQTHAPVPLRLRRPQQRRHGPELAEPGLRGVGPDRVWVGDITFVATREGWLHLAVLIDLYSRRVVGWAMGSQQNRQLVIDALTMAIEHRRPKPGLIHHTDQGILYATSAYRAILTAQHMIPSMAAKGLLRQRRGRELLLKPQERTHLAS